METAAATTGTGTGATATATARVTDRFTTGVARIPKIGRAGPLSLVLTAFELWRKLPPKQRQQMLKALRKHGPKAATALIARGRTVKNNKRR
jgi:hypothetical protein